ncbi:MAG: hypothetical protein ACYC69_02705 [Thermodesulfovibrionales bacterium]
MKRIKQRKIRTIAINSQGRGMKGKGDTVIYNGVRVELLFDKGSLLNILSSGPGSETVEEFLAGYGSKLQGYLAQYFNRYKPEEIVVGLSVAATPTQNPVDVKIYAVKNGHTDFKRINEVTALMKQGVTGSC